MSAENLESVLYTFLWRFANLTSDGSSHISSHLPRFTSFARFLREPPFFSMLEHIASVSLSMFDICDNFQIQSGIKIPVD